MENNLTICINNCKDCKNHYTEKVYTADSFEHEEGLYCSIVEDKNSYNKKHRLVAADDWNVTKYSKIPDWCPLLEKNKSSKTNQKTVVLVGITSSFNESISRLAQHENRKIERVHGIVNSSGAIVGINTDNLSKTLDACYNDDNKYEFIIIEVTAPNNEIKEIEEICSKYTDCKVVQTCTNLDTFDINNMKDIVLKIVDYFNSFK